MQKSFAETFSKHTTAVNSILDAALQHADFSKTHVLYYDQGRTSRFHTDATCTDSLTEKALSIKDLKPEENFTEFCRGCAVHIYSLYKLYTYYACLRSIVSTCSLSEGTEQSRSIKFFADIIMCFSSNLEDTVPSTHAPSFLKTARVSVDALFAFAKDYFEVPSCPESTLYVLHVNPARTLSLSADKVVQYKLQTTPRFKENEEALQSLIKYSTFAYPEFWYVSLPSAEASELPNAILPYIAAVPAALADTTWPSVLAFLKDGLSLTDAVHTALAV